jgi:CheY-like chemotaxis protein
MDIDLQLHSKRDSRLKSILLVEDSRFLRLAAEKALVRAGYSVTCASDGEEALRVAYANPPDLILLDMLLPKLGGAEVLHALRSNTLTTQVPVIILSSLSQKNETKLLEAGATAYFEKSKMELDRNGASLLQVVKEMLHRVNSDAPSQASEYTLRNVLERQT